MACSSVTCMTKHLHWQPRDLAQEMYLQVRQQSINHLSLWTEHYAAHKQSLWRHLCLDSRSGLVLSMTTLLPPANEELQRETHFCQVFSLSCAKQWSKIKLFEATDRGTNPIDVDVARWQQMPRHESWLASCNKKLHCGKRRKDLEYYIYRWQLVHISCEGKILTSRISDKNDSFLFFACDVSAISGGLVHQRSLQSWNKNPVKNTRTPHQHLPEGHDPEYRKATYGVKGRHFKLCCSVSEEEFLRGEERHVQVNRKQPMTS